MVLRRFLSYFDDTVSNIIVFLPVYTGSLLDVRHTILDLTYFIHISLVYCIPKAHIRLLKSDPCFAEAVLQIIPDIRVYCPNIFMFCTNNFGNLRASSEQIYGVDDP